MNNQNKKQIIMAAALGVVLLVVLVYQFGIKGVGPERGYKAPAPGKSPAAQTAKAAAGNMELKMKTTDVDIDSLLRSIKVVTFDYNMERIERNPMTPLVGRVQRVGDNMPVLSSRNANVVEVMQKSVSAIIWDEYEPAAVVDNEVVGVGYVYPTGVSVESIEPTRVIFRLGDSLIPVELKEL